MSQIKLGIDTVEDKYGKVELRVLKQNSENRESLLVNGNGEIGAYSLVFFCEQDERFKEAHQRIIAGAPIGRTFREMNIPIQRDEFCALSFPIPEELRKLTRWNTSECSVRGLNFYIGDPKILYATIIETYGSKIQIPEFEKIFRRKEAVIATLKTRFRSW